MKLVETTCTTLTISLPLYSVGTRCTEDISCHSRKNYRFFSNVVTLKHPLHKSVMPVRTTMSRKNDLSGYPRIDDHRLKRGFPQKFMNESRATGSQNL